MFFLIVFCIKSLYAKHHRYQIWAASCFHAPRRSLELLLNVLKHLGHISSFKALLIASFVSSSMNKFHSCFLLTLWIFLFFGKAHMWALELGLPHISHYPLQFHMRFCMMSSLQCQEDDEQSQSTCQSAQSEAVTGVVQRQVQTWESCEKLQEGDTTDIFFIE